jgi:hypothetical protein
MQRMVMELRGIACIGMDYEVPDRKSIIASPFFGRPSRHLLRCRKP